MNYRTTSMLAGRPKEYSKNIISKSKEYISICVDEVEEYHKTRGEKSDSYERIVLVKLPTIEGLAIHLGIARSTIYKWKEEYIEFSDILEELLAKQAEALISKGLSGEYAPAMAKLLLAKHGYKEERTTDITSGGETIGGFNFVRNTIKTN